jgi:glycerol-3-phosphate dehydrogenase
MHRDLTKLSENDYDLIVVGGGIFGVCACWDAVLRGLSVALLEKGDFSHATSANHFKIAHGGIRYLQHGDIYRIRESSHERSALLRIAPHLVSPLPIVIPTYGHGLKGRAVLGTGMLIYDLLTVDRNKGLQKGKKIPRGKFLSREQVMELFPGVESKGLTGGAVFYDGQIYNPPRIAVSFLKSAAEKGLDAANYVEVTGFLKNKNRIFGVAAKDNLSGNELEIRGKVVLNTSGPWAHKLLMETLNLDVTPAPTFSRDLALVVKKEAKTDFGLALTTKTEDADSILDRGGRHLFIVPWRNYTLIGVWHKVFENRPENIAVTDEELEDFINEINRIYPSMELSINDISMINTGLTLFGSTDKQGKMKMSFGKRSRIIDHKNEHRLEGLLTLIGVRATTARGMAERVINLVYKKLGKNAPKSNTDRIPIYGGDFDDLAKLLSDGCLQYGGKFGNDVIQRLVYNYGSRYTDIVKYFNENQMLLKQIDGSKVLKAEIVHAVREEMAQKLSDVVFRRTDLGTAGHPGENALNTCTQIMAHELGWNEQQMKKELDEVITTFQYLRNNVCYSAGGSK